jgi:molybdopterin-containing oxidoreductase family iron-sulfur binding subunit
MADDPMKPHDDSRGPRGRAFWRSLQELRGGPEFEDRLHREFPELASEWPEGLDRRRFLQLAGASFALAGLGACTRQPLESIVPYVKQPEEIIPGRPLFFATATTLGGYATGLLVESHEGRPTKIEGNPGHPASLGAADLFAQASILGLYDPDRSQLVLNLGEIRTWKAFVEALQARLTAQAPLGGDGIRILTGTVTSPTFAQQMRALRARFPKAKWHQYEPAGRDGARLGGRAAFGEWTETRYDFSRADVVVSLDADFTAVGPGSVRYARQFADRRRARDGRAAIARLYVAETTPSTAGTLADHRLAARAASVAAIAWALAEETGVPEAGGLSGMGGAAMALPPKQAAFVKAAAADLKAHAGRGLVIPGEFTPPVVHVLAHAINHHLGNAGAAAVHSAPVEPEPVDQAASLRGLVDDMRAGRVDVLAIVGGNPVYDAPADLDFAAALLKVPLRARLALEVDETSAYCQWHLPMAHELEAWGDARAFDGTATVMQPLIEPLYGGKSVHELLSAFVDETPRPGLEIVRATWQERARLRSVADGAGFESFWRRALHDGIVPGTALPPKTVTLRPGAVRDAAEAAAKAWSAGAGVAAVAGAGAGGDSGGGASDTGAAIEVNLRPDPCVHDGRFANNGWLQETPKPLSKLTWDNAALVSPATARALGVASEEVIEIAASGRAVQAPVWILPGHADGAITVHLGYGRTKVGRVGEGAGFDAYPLRTTGALWSYASAGVRRTGARLPLAATQEHFTMEGRALVRVATLDALRRDPEVIRAQGEAPAKDASFFPGFKYDGHAWGLSIDLSVCTGCNACVVACQAENNIPVVGKDQVSRGREMHWLRIDRYYEGSMDDPAIHHQPVMCMHCEQAPCEVVCPVGATVHSSEGLNDMVYNRCVGTRYCSNNCPYKVRRFNFLQYSDATTPVLKLQRNPNVTVRSRGVMEKCTYCVQRINAVRIDAEKEDREIRDGEIRTACQQTCPTQAIVFGDINDKGSKVAAWKAAPTHYGLLEELNTRPRTTYLAKITNPNPDAERS